MKSLIEISGADIAQLSDDDLRELIGLLSEADIKAKGFSPSGVKWGGHQDASDGGLDVVVEQVESFSEGFIQRKKNGFQVKKPDMRAAEIKKEMKPKGILRNSIKSLVKESGSYIIVSSKSSTTDKTLKARVNAMSETVSGENGYEKIHLDFYDQGRIATWVRLHPFLTLWVRNRIGRNFQGWHPYENWIQPGTEQDEYIIDAGIRFFDDNAAVVKREISIEEGINKVRQTLSEAGSCTRLVGLSGVGKTRFVQAVFDKKIGENTPDSSFVIYTDMSNAPEPTPKALVEQLIAMHTRAIMIIDNCNPEIHRQLTKLCSAGNSQISLITIEYDVRDDSPEETKVFRLEPASYELISKLLAKNFNHISEVDRRTIASFSGGNARVAIALANTVKRGETVSGLQDNELFERLFWQRNASDPQLLRVAQILSLVYSFDGTDINFDTSEISVLGSFIGKSALDMYSNIPELKSRNLIQERSQWRAILPQAIANRLAKKALTILPADYIATKFLSCGSERLLKSFTHRLSYLHDSKEAVQIAETWLTRDELLGNISQLNSSRINMFENVAPISPLETMRAIERTIATDSQFPTTSNQYYTKFIQILYSLAYDANLFSRSTKILLQFAFHENDDKRNNSAHDALKSLFSLYLSGTYATSEQRYNELEELLNDENFKQQELGILLLEAALRTQPSNTIHRHNFGARPRDYGYTPKTRFDILNWYSLYINKAVELIVKQTIYSNKFKTILANNFRGYWMKYHLYDILEEAVHKILTKGLWIEGWVQVRKIIFFDKSKMNEEGLKILHAIHELINPKDLKELVEAYALSDSTNYYDYVDDFEEFNKNPGASRMRSEEITYDLGIQLSKDRNLLETLLPSLLSKPGSRLLSLGQGLANGADDKSKLWEKLMQQIAVTQSEYRNINLLLGFIKGLSQCEPNLTDVILDNILLHPILGKWFPHFQVDAGIDKKGIQRLHLALDNNICPINIFYCLAYAQTHTITDKELAYLLSKMDSKENGDSVTLFLIAMRIDNYAKQNKIDPALLSVARAILGNYKFATEGMYRSFLIHQLSKVTEICFTGEYKNEDFRAACKNVAEAIISHKTSISECSEFVNALAQIQPKIFLDVFMEPYETFGWTQLLLENLEFSENPISKIIDSEIVSWCETNPEIRYPLMLEVIEPFTLSAELNLLKWNPVVYTILKNIPERKAALSKLENLIRPNSWTGTLVETLRNRLSPLETFFNHNEPEIANWAKKVHRELISEIKREEEVEKAFDLRSEGFE